MTIDQIAAVRGFNRVVAQRIGALEDHYLSEEQSLGEARVLFEIGSAGSGRSRWAGSAPGSDSTPAT